MKAGTSMKAGSHCKMMLAARMSTAAVNPHIEYFTPAGLSKSKKCTRKTTFRNDKSSYRCASSCQESTQNKTFIISQLKISKNSPLFCPVNEENTCSRTFSNSMNMSHPCGPYIARRQNRYMSSDFAPKSGLHLNKLHLELGCKCKLHPN